MTYQIYYVPKDDDQNSRGFCLFNIEYYEKQYESDKKLWYSEIDCLPCVDGMTYLLKDMFENKDFDYKTFINDATEIQELRGLLFERFDNKPKPSEENSDFHYHVFGKRVREIIDEFCKKYNCWLNID